MIADVDGRVLPVTPLVLDDARLLEAMATVPGTPVLGIGEVDKAVVAGLGAKREVVHITAQGAGDLHVVSIPFHS